MKKICGPFLWSEGASVLEVRQGISPFAAHRKTYERQELFREGWMSTREVPTRRSTVKCFEVKVRASAFRQGHICVDYRVLT